MKRLQEPTQVSRVWEVLMVRQDFIDIALIMRMTGLPKKNVSPALYHLRAYGAADQVEEKDGTTWWFPTPQTDRRQRRLEKRAVEYKPRKPRKAHHALARGTKGHPIPNDAP